MNRVERHGLVRAQEYGRFIHVVPETGNAHVGEILVETAPPAASAGEREVWKDAWAGPDLADVDRAIRIFDENVVLHARIIGRVTLVRIPGDVQVGDRNRVKSFGAEVFDHLLESRKVLAVDGEGAIAVLVVDVEIDDVGRDLFLAEHFRNLADTRFGIVAVAALLIAEGPVRRQRRAANERGELFEDFLRLRSGEKVVVQLATFGADRKSSGSADAKVEIRAMSVVEKKAVGKTFAQADEEGDRFVNGIRGLLPAISVGVPKGESTVATVHRTRFVTEANVNFVFGHLLPHADARSVPGHGKGRLIGQENFAGSVEEADEQRRFLNLYVDAARANENFAFRFLNLDRRRFGGFNHRPGQVFGKVAIGRDADADDTLAKGGDAHARFACGQLDAVLEFFHALDRADVLPALRPARRAEEERRGREGSRTTNESGHDEPPEQAGHPRKLENGIAVQAASQCSKNALAFAPSMRRRTASRTRQRRALLEP